MDNKTRDEFIENNLPLVHSLCKRFVGKGIEYDDLFSTGCMGLVKAADNFDTNRGFSFSTYAVPVILGELKRLFRDGGSIKVSRSLKELYLKMQKAKQKLELKLGREPTTNEIAEALGVETETAVLAVTALRPTVSLTYEDSENKDIQNDVKDNGYTDNLIDKLTIEDTLKKLSDDEAKIIELRYFKFLTQKETAEKLNMTQVQISRKERKILLKMRAIMGNAS
ncbi:MAG: sigma-70 family RNA polymerase sigma factor [Clostridia bacterium]|nr:sigma-70 family RNA polymerase sigma factor [Clostridia bacterium]